jgi:hypothetical protein
MESGPKQWDSGKEDLFRSKLKNGIKLRHELVRLRELIDMALIAAYYKEAKRLGLSISTEGAERKK